MSLASGVSALATRVAQEFNSLRSQITTSLAAKADDSTVVKLTGAQNVAGIKTFTSAPSVPTPGSPGNPVRNDDGRLSDTRSPTAGSVTNSSVAGGAGIEETKLSLASDAAAGVASRRTLGTGAQQAAAGNDSRIVGAAPKASPTFTGTVTLPGDPTTTLGAATKSYVDAHAGAGGLAGYFSVKDYGAIGNGTADDTAAINSAIAAALAAPGGIVWFPSGTYGTTSVIDIPENVTLEGVHGDTIPYDTSPPMPCVVKPLASHTGTAILRMRGKTLTGRTYDHVGARVRHLTLDGTNSPAHTLGIQLIDLVREAELDHVTINAATDTAFSFDANGSASPQSLRILHCLAKASQWNGFKFTNVPDTTMFDCNSLGALNVGFSVQGFMNGQIANCRAEWSGQHGFYFTSGYWGNGQGSGGVIASSLTTDRNGYHGCYIDATGAGVLQINGMVNRRDGRNNGAGGGNYAGFAVASTATMPVIADNLQVYPGVDDNGTGVNSPQYGVYSPGANLVNVDSGYIFAATTAVSGGAGLTVANSVGTATGTTAAPTRVAPVGDVPTSQRGPIGGVVTLTYAATITPNAGTASEQRVVATGALAVNVPTSGTDGQYLLLWVQASGADRTVTMAAAYENTQPVPGDVFTVPSGTWGSVLVRNRGGTWVMMAATPQPGVSPVSYVSGSTWTPDATVANEQRMSLATNLALGLPTGGTDGQKLLIVITASGATRTVTLNGSYELGGVVTSRTVTIASGLTAYIGLHCRGGTWRLLAVDAGS